MKALTIWQPWAQLLAIGAKEYETRGWATKYRGPIAIHAELKKTWGSDPLPIEPFRSALRDRGILAYSALPLGCIVAVGNLTAIYDAAKLYPKISELERAFGDFSPGRYAWRIEHVVLLAKPIPVKGRQGLWDAKF